MADAPTEAGLVSLNFATGNPVVDISMCRQVGTIVRCRVLGAVCLIDEGQERSGRGWRMHRMQDAE